MTDQRRLQEDARTRVAKLSPEERELLEFLLGGSSMFVIAERIGVSGEAISTLRESMLTKLDVTSNVAAVRIAIYAGLQERFS